MAKAKLSKTFIDGLTFVKDGKRQFYHDTSLKGFMLIVTSQQIGIRGARVLLDLSPSQFYRFKADAKKLQQNTKCSRFRALSMIRAQLTEFIPLLRDDIIDEGLL